MQAQEQKRRRRIIMTANYKPEFVRDMGIDGKIKSIELSPTFKERLSIRSAVIDEKEDALFIITATQNQKKSIYMPLGDYHTAEENAENFRELAEERGYEPGPAAALSYYLKNIVFSVREEQQARELSTVDQEGE
jgi:hypothetical protein